MNVVTNDAGPTRNESSSRHLFTEYGHWGTLLVDKIHQRLKTDRIKPKLGF